MKDQNQCLAPSNENRTGKKKKVKNLVPLDEKESTLHLSAADKVSGSGVLDEAAGASVHKMDGLKLRAQTSGRVIRTLAAPAPQISQREYLPKVAIKGGSALPRMNNTDLPDKCIHCIAR